MTFAVKKGRRKKSQAEPHDPDTSRVRLYKRLPQNYTMLLVRGHSRVESLAAVEIEQSSRSSP